MKTENKTSIFIYILLFIAMVMVIMDFFNPFGIQISSDASTAMHALFRFISGALILLLIRSLRWKSLTGWHPIREHGWIMVPAFVISINNFPFSAFFQGRTTWIEPNLRLILFMVECLSVGFFEEIVFRGILLTLLVHLWAKHRQGMLLSIIVSSAIFGIAHLFNVYDLGVQAMMLQIGYSFLMGMLWAVMYLKTKNLWMVMLMHATYNFFGQVLFTMGSVQQRFDLLTIILTTILAIVAAVCSIRTYISITKESSFTKSTHPERSS